MAVGDYEENFTGYMKAGYYMYHLSHGLELVEYTAIFTAYEWIDKLCILPILPIIPILCIIGIVAGAKNSHYTHGISIGKGSIYRSFSELFSKGFVMTAPFIILAIWKDDLQSAYIMALASMQLVVGYSVGYAVQRWVRPQLSSERLRFITTKTVTGELLGGAIMGFCLTIGG